MPYIFVVASVIAVFAVVFIIKYSMDKVKADPDVNLGKVQQNLFLGVGLAEFIPIILVVVGFAMMGVFARPLEKVYFGIIQKYNP